MSHRAGRSQRLSSSAGQRARTRPAWNTAFGSAAGWRSRSRPLARDTRRAAARGSESWPGAPAPPPSPALQRERHAPARAWIRAASSMHAPAATPTISAAADACQASAPRLQDPRGHLWAASLCFPTRGAGHSRSGCPGHTGQTVLWKSAGPAGLTPEPAEEPWSPQKQPPTPTVQLAPRREDQVP